MIHHVSYRYRRPVGLSLLLQELELRPQVSTGFHAFAVSSVVDRPSSVVHQPVQRAFKLIFYIHVLHEELTRYAYLIPNAR